MKLKKTPIFDLAGCCGYACPSKGIEIVECEKGLADSVIEGGVEYFCSDECLHKHYTDEEYLEMYDEGNGDTYWTEYDDEGGTINSDIFKPNEA